MDVNDDMDVNENDRIFEFDVAAAVHFLMEALGFNDNDDFANLLRQIPIFTRVMGLL